MFIYNFLAGPRCSAGIVAGNCSKKVLGMAGVQDVFTSTTGSTKTLGNFVKATYFALKKTYGFLSPELWRETNFTKAGLLSRPIKPPAGLTPSQTASRTYTLVY